MNRMSVEEYQKQNIPTEEEDQIELAKILDKVKYNGRPLRWCHVPNGGKRHIGTALKMKKAGVKPGLPDILIFDPPPKFIDQNAKGAVIELKRLKGGKVSAEQLDWLNYFDETDWFVGTCKGLNAAINFLKICGYIK